MSGPDHRGERRAAAWAGSPAPGGTVLVVTGAAGTGKSTAAIALAAGSGGRLCVLDGDTIAAARDEWDYDEYWDHVMAICGDVLRSALVPVVCGIGLPSQVVPAADRVAVRVRMLALVCSADTIRRRTSARGYGGAGRDPEKHVRIDRMLRAASVPAPHELSSLDTDADDRAAVAHAVVRWALGDAASPPPERPAGSRPAVGPRR